MLDNQILNFKHQASSINIQHPTSSIHIQHQASSIKHQASSINIKYNAENIFKKTSYIPNDNMYGSDFISCRNFRSEIR
ncbi:hypothetical protein QUF72_01650 [Desulfobacterales bacterium HSG2]|nr:hypothetical protein [Desulfobacterales bacterium HSG2]